ncbi:MAG: DUF4446 family protein [Butyrivibrio sp.]|nr:DUF4446 family protein [Butyrivibrio sp.]
MDSNLFNMIGLGGLDPAYIFIGLIVVIIILLVLLILQNSKIKKMEKRISNFMGGKEAESLENEIVGLFEDNKFIKNETEKNKKEIDDLYKRVSYCFQKMGIVKYDAFNQMGGQLSFSLALLDENNNGFLMNSVHSAEGCYSYTKEIINGKSKLELGEEERQALDEALAQ